VKHSGVILFALLFLLCTSARAQKSEETLLSHPLLQEINLESGLLTKFWKKPMTVKAAVLLPAGYAENPDKKYPVRYNVAGYGGRYTRVNRLMKNEEFTTWWTSGEAPEIITVFLDGSGPYGDSYQLNSDNSGPYGDVLTREIIPAIDGTYRTEGTTGRYTDGCSTGGWVSLALQLYYPDKFAGCWSYSPDPVSFYRTQLINIYEDENAFVNSKGYERPSKRDRYGEPELSIRKEVADENKMGESGTYVDSGQQWGAWNALYSPRGEDGLPVPVFHPTTGVIDKTVAKSWDKYDLLKHVQANWAELGPKVQGKIYVWMGDMDNYYLNNALRDFDAYLKTTTNPTSDANIVFEPTKGHCDEYGHRRALEQIAASRK
jgi:enterochelin esterase-like enzyme